MLGGHWAKHGNVLMVHLAVDESFGFRANLRKFFLTVYHIKTYPKNTFTISGWKLNNSKIWATTYVDLGRTYF